MKISMAKARVRALEAAGIVPFLEGPPGCAKSRGVWQLGDEDGIETVDIRLSLLNPVDIRGIPVVKGDRVEWVPPTFFKREGPCRFFFDELPNAPQATQQAAYQLVLDNAIGEFRLNRTMHMTKTGLRRPMHTIVAAGNRATDQAFINQMPAPLRNRMCMIHVEPDLDDWKDWALPAGINPLVVQFLTFTARVKAGIGDSSPYGLLFWFDPKVHAQTAFPTPRSWEHVSRFIAANPRLAMDTETLAGFVGEAVAVKFSAFVKVADKLPNAEAVLDGNIDLRPPDAQRDPGALYAFCGALTAAMIRRPEDGDARLDAARNVSAYCVKWWRADAEEFAVLTMKDFGRTAEFKAIYRKVIVTKEWRDFTATFKGLLL